MISDTWNTIFYEPLYNGLVFLLDITPGGDVGFAIIILTIAVKTAILPLAHKSTKSQAKMKKLEPDLKRIREEHKNDKQEQARKTMELYEKHGVNPFSGCLLVLMQLPIIMALYFVFYKGIANGIDTSLLYSFVAAPEAINMVFLGIVDLAAKSLPLALLAGISQYYQMRLSMPPVEPSTGSTGAHSDPKDDFARTFSTQMRYVLPGVVFIVAYQISAAVALYWFVSNLYSIAHELIVKRTGGSESDALTTA